MNKESHDDDVTFMKIEGRRRKEKMPKDTFFNLPEEKKDRVLDAAIDEFARRPFYKAKISSIVKKAEIAKGSFYQYFEDKKDLYKHIMEISAQKKLSYINQDMMRNMDNYGFFELLREVYQSGFRFAKEYPRLVSIANMLVNSSEELYQEIFKEQKHKSIDFFQQVLERGVEKGELDPKIDPRLVAKLLTTLSNSMAELIFEDGKLDSDDMETIDKMLYIIENGIKNNSG